ncbi:hypothetical protein GINT2_000624 [Glugoides intestinalis]
MMPNRRDKTCNSICGVNYRGQINSMCHLLGGYDKHCMRCGMQLLDTNGYNFQFARNSLAFIDLKIISKKIIRNRKVKEESTSDIIDSPKSIFSTDEHDKKALLPSNCIEFDIFLNSLTFTKSILNAILFKLIETRNSFSLLDSFKDVLSFFPKTLLFGYILLMRFADLAPCNPLEVPRLYLACCITASKIQSDIRVSNINIIPKDLLLTDANYLEGFVLNKLGYDVCITRTDIITAIKDIIGVSILKASDKVQIV